MAECQSDKAAEERPRISVVIPTFNERDRIREAICSARAAGRCEVIVADGGSTDGTPAEAAGADRLLQAERGRSSQQNAGARVASGETLLFLHADCRLPANALAAVRAALEDRRVVAGCFRQRIDAAGLRFRLLERGNALRVRALKWAYGDQGIFVRREAFEDVGGFPPLPLMEDLYLMKRLKRRGSVVLLPERIVVSARRWRTHGFVRQTAKNWTLLALAHLGVSPERLARWYPAVR